MAYITTRKDLKDMSITIYNDNFGVVREKRNLKLPENEEYIQYMDVAKAIETDSIIVNGLDIIELNYDYDLVSKEKLFEKYMDKIVYLFDKERGIKEQCRLLSVSGGIVLEKSATGEISVNPDGELILPKLPEELIIKPTLIWKVKPSNASEVGVSYITKSIEWEAQYVIYFGQKKLNLTGWVNIKNNSGTSYENASIKLIAGEVNRVKNYRPICFYEPDDILESKEISPNFEEQSFSDYHMYTLQRRTTLKDNQSKQISFLNVESIAFKKYYDTSYKLGKARIIIEFENNKDNGLGIPFPKGNIKSYQEDDKDGSLEFIGEDSIDHTPKNEKIKIYLGDAFDIVCNGRKLKSKRDKNGVEYRTFEYTIKNHKEEEALIKASFFISDNDWDMVSASDDYEVVSSDMIFFWVKVQANSEKKIEFQYKFRNEILVKVKKE